MSDDGPQAADKGGMRRRRRAVGPVGTSPEQPVGAALSGAGLSGAGLSAEGGPGADDHESDADDRLRREVPPHHGG